jgi:hypothetical protein
MFLIASPHPRPSLTSRAGMETNMALCVSICFQSLSKNVLSSREYTRASVHIWQWRLHSLGSATPRSTIRETETHRDRTSEKRSMTCTMSLRRACGIVGPPEPDP